MTSPLVRSLATIRALVSKPVRRRLKRLPGFRFAEQCAFRLLHGDDLRALAQLYGTDKWGSHWYAQHYQTFFSSLRTRALNILEIGIGGYENPEDGGGSLRMWRAYFPRAKMYGIDIHDKRLHNERRIKTYRGSQVDATFLNSVIAEIGRVDIIIDDGSHINEHVITSFELLFPHLSGDGLYVVEDTQTSYWPELGGSSRELKSERTSMGFFKRLIDGMNFSEYRITGYTPTYYDLHIVAMHFYHNLVFIQKGNNSEASNMPHSVATSASASDSLS
jgi:hypothetical protein